MQICEQKNEKKNGMGIEFVIFFSHTSITLKLQKKFLLFLIKNEKSKYENSSSIW